MIFVELLLILECTTELRVSVVATARTTQAYSQSLNSLGLKTGFISLERFFRSSIVDTMNWFQNSMSD